MDLRNRNRPKSNSANSKFIPDPEWKKWTYEKLAPSMNLWISDIDSIIRSRNGCMVIVEIKRKGRVMPVAQKKTYQMVAAALKAAEGTKISHPEFCPQPMFLKRFHGIAEISFENTFFHDGKVKLNGVESSEEEIIRFLSFDEYCSDCYPTDCEDCCDC